MFTRMPSDLNGIDVRSLEPQTPTPIYRNRADHFDEGTTDREDSETETIDDETEDSILTDSQDPSEDLLNSPYFDEANSDKIMDDAGVQLSDTETDCVADNLSQQSIRQEELPKTKDDSGQSSSDTEIASKYTTPLKQRQGSPCPPPTPADRQAVRDLGHVIDKASHKATFTCGGSIPIILDPNRKEDGSLTPRTNDKLQQQRITTKPVSIRWEADGSSGKISLPTENTEALQELVNACLPATFGREGKDVFDESYRRAGAMSTDNFTTSFCPYQLGIVDILTQLLVPGIVGDLQPPRPAPPIVMEYQEELSIRDAFQSFRKQYRATTMLIHHADIPQAVSSIGLPMEEGCGLRNALRPDGAFSWSDFRECAEQHILEIKTKAAEERQPLEGKKRFFRGLRAELYKLNVCSGPSGLFKAHVDTPRSEDQIGSLVVALPNAFQGGALAVRHNGREVVHDWASTSPDDPAIQWAAFYSDCEHEVLPVTAGHRITLTYNLYISRGTGLLNVQPTGLLPETLPFHNHLEKLLSNPDFMPQGGFIGRHLSHSYPHTHETLHQFVPRMLKGVDMAVYESCVAAGLTSYLTPYPFPLDSYDQITSPTRKAVHNLLQAMNINEGESYNEDYIDSDASDINNLPTYGNDKVHAMREREKFEEEIVWLNETEGYKEVRNAFLVYGNVASQTVKYSSVALIATIPGWGERMGEESSVEGAIEDEE